MALMRCYTSIPHINKVRAARAVGLNVVPDTDTANANTNMHTSKTAKVKS